MTDLTIENAQLQLAVSVYGSDCAPDILCLHGISNSRDTWQELVARLQDRYRVWTLDFRGHGHSDRSASYLLPDYASDAAAVLDIIAKPTVIIGHSLGGIVAAFLAQQPYPNIKAVFLEDPPMYLNEELEWNKTVLSKAFPILRDQQIALQHTRSTLKQFVEFAANSPSIQGGVVADHQSQRHLESNGSALQRHDPASWEPALDMRMLAAIDTAMPIKVPTTLIQADPKLGPAFLEGHETRFITTNPHANVIMYANSPHRIHATRVNEAKFLSDVEAFLALHASQQAVS